MRNWMKVILTGIFLLSLLVIKVSAQNQPVEFRHEKSLIDSGKIEIKVMITRGEGPFTCIVYQGDPLENGKSLKEEKTSSKEFKITVDNKTDLYLYISCAIQGEKKSFKIVPLE